MKRLVRLADGTSPLLVAFLAAVAVHGLVFSFLHLKRDKQVAAPSLLSRDNTPELLRLASQPAPLTTVDVLPLPKASVLPPPPSGLLSPLRQSRASSRRGGGLTSGRPSTTLPGPSRKTTQRLVAPKPGPSLNRESPATSVSPNQALPEEVTLARETLRAFQNRHLTLSQASSPNPANLPGRQRDVHLQPKVVSPVEPSLQEAYQALWTSARPVIQPIRSTGSLETAKGSIEIRQLPLEQYRGKNLEVHHQQIVILPDNILLFWLDGETLWLLQSPRDASAEP